jgi:multiple sugar transport system permease protein
MLASQVKRGARAAVGIVAIALVVFSFSRVALRFFRSNESQKDVVRITVLHWGEKNEDDIMRSLVDDFLKQPENKNTRVQRINLGQAADVRTKLQTMFAAGVPPDVFYLGYENFAEMASKDLLTDMDALIAQDHKAGIPTLDLADFFPAPVNVYRYNSTTDRMGSGTLFALPKDFTPVGFYYNRDLFRRAGVADPPRDGWTWDQFIDAARKIAKLPDCYGADFVTWETMVRIYLWNCGIDFGTSRGGEDGFLDPKLHMALERLRSWFHDEDRTLVSAKTQFETLMEPFLAGNVGMAGPLGRWKTPMYRLITKFDWDFAPIPHGVGCKPRNGIFTAGWAIARSSPHKDAAWRFVKYMGGQHGQAMMCRAGLAIPTIRNVARNMVAADAKEKPRNCQAFLDAAEYAEMIEWPADTKYQSQIRTRTEEIFKLNQPARPAMERVAREWRAYDEYDRPRSSYRPMPWRTISYFIAMPCLAILLVAAMLWWRKRPRGLELSEELSGALMVSPWVIGFAVFTAIPIVMSLLLAFTQWNGLMTLDKALWVGVDNFRILWKGDQTFRRALSVTAWYALLAVPTGQLAALGTAMLMNREQRGIGVYRAIWYLPSVLAGVGMAVMWKWVFHHEHGLARALLDPVLPFGWKSPAWFEKDATTWGVPAFVIVNLWSLGGTMMVYLAGLKGISKDLYEAAAIDGAVGWRKFVHVTLPMLSPVILFNVVIALIASFQIFTQAFVMTRGGPGDATRFYVVYLYNQAFDYHEMGYASALAWLLLLIVLVLTLAVMRGTRRFVHYEALR